MRAVYGGVWLSGWDLVTAGVGVWLLDAPEPISRIGSGAALFDDLEVRRRQAVVGALEVIAPLIASTQTDLPPGTSSPGQARRFVAAFLNDDAYTGLDDVALLVSELVTNAVSHADSAPQIVVQVTSSILRVEVHDDSPELPMPREPDVDRPGGRGLHLLTNSALEWGTERRPGGKSVWFHYALRPNAAAPSLVAPAGPVSAVTGRRERGTGGSQQ